MYTRILTPIDGSPTSKRGLMEAITLAKDQKAKLSLLHVVDASFLAFDVYGGGYWGEVTRTLREGGERLIAQSKALAAGQGVEAGNAMVGGVVVESAVVETMKNERVADRILNDAREWRADLIVMGTHGRRGFLHLVLGSDAEAVLHGATIPVLLIKAEPAADKEFLTGRQM